MTAVICSLATAYQRNLKISSLYLMTIHHQAFHSVEYLANFVLQGYHLHRQTMSTIQVMLLLNYVLISLQTCMMMGNLCELNDVFVF